MLALRPWWPVAWLATTAALYAYFSQFELGWVAPLFYVGMNGLAVAIEWLRFRSLTDRFMVILGWAAALQLPVMLWVYFSPKESRLTGDVSQHQEFDNRVTRLHDPSIGQRKGTDPSHGV